MTERPAKLGGMEAARSPRLSERLRFGRRNNGRTARGGERSQLRDLVIITGYSGAGKSTAMHVFEDAGYFCVDNLPPEMIRPLAELFMHEGSKVERAAVVSDVRGGDYFEGLVEVLDDLDRAGRRPPRAVPRRRRPDAAHPLQGDAPPPSARAATAAWRRDRRRARAARAARASAPTWYRHDRAQRGELRRKLADELLPTARRASSPSPS